MWQRKNLNLEGKIIIFKILALSKFLFLAQVLPIVTVCNNFQNRSLKNLDISSKIYNLQCSWVKKRHDQNSHD